MLTTKSRRTALVTGSTSGIGQEIAAAFAREGMNVVLNGFGDAAAIEAQQTRLAGLHGAAIRYHGADMTKPAEIADMVATSPTEFGAIDVLVNNAGIQHVAPIDEFPIDKWDAIIAINRSGGACGLSRLRCGGIDHRRRHPDRRQLVVSIDVVKTATGPRGPVVRVETARIRSKSSIRSRKSSSRSGS
jgi:NAD(P)-dependent dehydrogenase (short-subunit alcohol dehydrogenase family)